MRKSRFSEAQIIGMIKEQEAGMPTADVCRKYGLSQGTFYKFKSQYGGMEVSDTAKLRAVTQGATHRHFQPTVALGAALQRQHPPQP